MPRETSTKVLVLVMPKRTDYNKICEMKTMKLWRIAFMMLAAFSLASCSSDDDVTDNVFN